MKKMIILLIALMVISVGFLSGCEEEDNEEVSIDDGNEDNSNGENTTDDDDESVKANITSYIVNSRITKRNQDGSSTTYYSNGFSYKWEDDEGMFRDFQVIATVKNVAGEYLNEIVILARFLDEEGNDLNIERTKTVTDLPNTYTKEVYFYVFDSETDYYDNVESVTFEIISTS